VGRVTSVELLTAEDIKMMRGELDIDRYLPPIPPKKTYWNVYRIVATLEAMSKPDLFRIDESGDITKVECANCGSPKEETQVNDYSI